MTRTARQTFGLRSGIAGATDLEPTDRGSRAFNFGEGSIEPPKTGLRGAGKVLN